MENNDFQLTCKVPGSRHSKNFSLSSWDGWAMNNLRVVRFTRARHYGKVKVVVILVKKGETEEQAWRRHLAENPQDHRADIKIYHMD